MKSVILISQLRYRSTIVFEATSKCPYVIYRFFLYSLSFIVIRLWNLRVSSPYSIVIIRAIGGLAESPTTVHTNRTLVGYDVKH